MLGGHQKCQDLGHGSRGDHGIRVLFRQNAAVLCINDHGVFAGEIIAQLNGTLGFPRLKSNRLCLRFLRHLVDWRRGNRIICTAVLRLALKGPGGQQSHKKD